MLIDVATRCYMSVVSGTSNIIYAHSYPICSQNNYNVFPLICYFPLLSPCPMSFPNTYQVMLCFFGHVKVPWGYAIPKIIFYIVDILVNTRILADHPPHLFHFAPITHFLPCYQY
jgi:hypothetical protein